MSSLKKLLSFMILAGILAVLAGCPPPGGPGGPGGGDAGHGGGHGGDDPQPRRH